MRIRAFVPFVMLSAIGVPVAPRSAAAQSWTLPDSVRRGVDDVFDSVGRGEPGCALGVVQDGLLAYGRGYGLANLDWGIPLSTSTVFDIGSVSKQFTATAVVLLALDGVLSLDDDVRRWVPEMPEYGRPVTLRHLLHHTSGVRDYLTLESIAGTDFDDVYDEFEGVDMITRQKGLNFAPGTDYLYSNSGYLLLAHVVRRATGESLRSVLERRVFAPLGMAHTSIWDDNTEILAERATGYEPAGDDGWRIDHAWNFQMGGDGQVITSVEDLAKWDANFYEPVVGGPALLERLHTRGVLTGGDTIPYALGLVVDEYRGLRRVQHGGSWAGFRAALVRFPDERTTVITLCNRADANPTARAADVADVVLAGRFPETQVAEAEGEPAEAPEAVPLTAAEMARWEGLYRHPDRVAYVEMRMEEGGLVARRGGRDLPLAPLSATTFVVEGGGPTITFDEGEGGVGARIGDETYREVPRASAPLSDYAGVYRSDELEVNFRASSEDGRLRLRRVGEEEGGMLLEPGTDDEFFGRPGSVVFRREAGRVVGFRLEVGRVAGLDFRRVEG